MRKIDTIIIHCSATPPGRQVTASQIDAWHKGRGWSGIGYHFVIGRSGRVEKGRPISKIGAHARGHNRNSIGICLVGGIAPGTRDPENNFTEAQWGSLFELVTNLSNDLEITNIIGHNEVSNKACPSFDVQNWVVKHL